MAGTLLKTQDMGHPGIGHGQAGNSRFYESQGNDEKTFGPCTIPPVKVSHHTFSQKTIIYHAIHILTIYNRIKVL